MVGMHCVLDKRMVSDHGKAEIIEDWRMVDL